jgi:hypothetical protein
MKFIEGKKIHLAIFHILGPFGYLLLWLKREGDDGKR